MPAYRHMAVRGEAAYKTWATYGVIIPPIRAIVPQVPSPSARTEVG